MEPDAAALEGLGQHGDFVVDIGAFSGSYTALLSRLVGRTGEVWSIEPVPDTFRILSYCVAAANLQNVRLFNLALSDSWGTGTMEIPRYKDGRETWYDARLVTSGSKLRTFMVHTATLDSLLANIERPVRFIKCDVEYHELPCVRGAIRTIRKWKPILLIEFLMSPDCEGTPQSDLLGLLGEEGYTPYVFDRGELLERKVGQITQNLWFLPSSSTFPVQGPIVGANT